MWKKIVLFLILISVFDLPLGRVSAAGDYTKIGDNELRGAWIASVLNINFPSKPGLSANAQKAELDDIVKNCKEANLNAIFFQVRPAGDALYDSEYFPTSKYLTGKQGDPFSGGFDPLKYIIEIAHKNDIELHAWINPYRISTDTTNVNTLAKNNPARQNPSWAVAYNGMLFYNPGLPEVRELITEGVIEIIRNYDIDGIHFDDYFYPYPDGKGTAFGDAATYQKYGSEYKTVDDFRRASVNLLVEGVYKAIKKENPNVRFGIAPFGIWANKSARAPTGSATNGFESYYSIYSDSKAWIDGGYIDYICPQVYWAFGTTVAPFDVLVRWWSAAVDGTGVDLYIGHAAYKVPTDFKSELELPRQVEYARTYMGVSGSVFYGYSNIAENDYKLKENLAKMFASPRKISKPASTGAQVSFGRPRTGSTVTDASVNIMGASDPAYPVYYNGEKLTRTKSGFFTVYVPLKDGKNNIVFTQNSINYTEEITKGKYAAAPPSETTTETTQPDPAEEPNTKPKPIDESAFGPCQVKKDYSHLKISTTSEFYNDYLPASVGMRDNVVGFSNGYYKLGFGGWIAAENVVMLEGKTLLVNRILSAGSENMGSVTEIRFAVTENVPVDAKCKDGVFTITLFNTPGGAPPLELADNPVLQTVRRSSDRAKKTATYSFDLKDPDNWYGFDVVYEGGFVVIKVKNPMKKIEGERPLSGLTIIVDAGHGGGDTGALGFLTSKSEKDLNLDIALATQTKLISLGANVIMIRESDETVDIYKRMDMYNEINPDLLISIHHNSLGDAQDNTRVRGVLGLYCNDSGRLLAKSTSSAISSGLNRVERDVRYQALAMLRSHRFPAALFEMSFITNPDEYEFTASAEGVRRSADAVAEGVLKWIEDQQKWARN